MTSSSRHHSSHHSRPTRPHHRHRHPQDRTVKDREEITLLDLDEFRDDIRIGIKETSHLNHIEAFLKRRYQDDDHSIPDDALIDFYWNGRLLEGDEIPRGISSLRYRVLKGTEDGRIQISWSGRVQLDGFVDKLSDDVELGITVGSLRRTIASLLHVDDPHRVVVTARGGLRPGLLQGNNWDISKIKNWFCRIVFIDLVPPQNYLLLKGVNESYTYHPPNARDNQLIDYRSLRDWLKDRVLTNVHHRSASRLRVDDGDIRCFCRGKILTKRSRITLGQTVRFELAQVVEERFIDEEAWLVPLTEVCIVCSDDKRASEMPDRITETCEHDANTCKDCVSQWIVSSMDTVAWDRLKCPECPQLLRFDDVRRFATKEAFARYDHLATRAAVTDIRDFRWCLNPRCNSGQIQRAECPKIKCHACKAASCWEHNVPWHSRETCEQYDRRTRDQKKKDKASEKKVKEMSKECPQCHRAVWKFQGCDHITCVCGYEWCYVCLAKYYNDRNSLLQCKHERTCRYFENPPIYEGDRVIRQFMNQPDQGRPFRPPPRPPPFPHWAGPRHAPLGPFPRRPAPPQVHIRDPPPGAGNANENADPFQFLLRDFFNNGNVNVNHVRQGHAHEFLGAAALFTMEQLMQRAR